MGEWERIAEHRINRNMAMGVAVFLGVGFGFAHHFFLDLDFTPRWELLGWLAAAAFTLIFVHEGIHGLMARMLGHKPVFGFKPPLVYTTFRDRIPRGHLAAIALAPLVLLSAVFVTLFQLGVVRMYCVLSFELNLMGSIGDSWIAMKLFGHGRGAWVQDTKTGIEIWRKA